MLFHPLDTVRMIRNARLWQGRGVALRYRYAEVISKEVDVHRTLLDSESRISPEAQLHVRSKVKKFCSSLRRQKNVCKEAPKRS